jgi:hypothetical protein
MTFVHQKDCASPSYDHSALALIVLVAPAGLCASLRQRPAIRLLADEQRLLLEASGRSKSSRTIIEAV